MQQFNLGETCGAQHIHLEHERARGVFFRDVSKNCIAVFFILESNQIIGIALSHQRLDSRGGLFDHIANP